jgi:hypothetical protein
MLPEWFITAPILVLLPIAGVWVYRPYWSFLVLPMAVVLLGATKRVESPPVVRIPESPAVARDEGSSVPVR